jgi:hypothetical protein
VRIAITALALLAAAPVLAAPARAPATPPVTLGQAEIAARVTNTIARGGELGAITGAPGLSQPELSELSKLAGCKPSVVPGGTKWSIILNWLCSKPVDGVDARQTELGFGDDGSWSDLTINPVKAHFAPTQVALASGKVESPAKLMRRFAIAVRGGGDPSLGGLIPLTSLQREQLAALAGRSFELFHWPRKAEAYVTWDNKKAPGRTAEVYFDEQRRPVGVLIGKFVIRTSREMITL